MSVAPPRLAPLLLVLIVCGAHALALRTGGHTVPASPWAAAELVVPGLFAQVEGSMAKPFAVSVWPGRQSLAWASLAPGDQEATLGSPYVGLIALWLTVAGLLPARTSSARLPGVARIVLFALAIGAGVMLRQSFLIVAALSVSAAVGLCRIHPGTDATEVRPLLVAAGCCVLVTAVLIALSLRAGFATDGQALQPLLSPLDDPARGSFDSTRLALEAGHLRAVLDRAALAAFLGMTALLLHLKSRARWSAALLLVVAAADVLSVAL